MKTDKITFDLKNRGRRHTGNPRAYESPKGAARIARIINSASVQERVKAGDMKGFLGHLPRQVAGTPYPPETALKDGKVYYFEPAFRTVAISATNDGVITHEAEFLDNPPGRIAARQWANQDGGFSAIIDDSSPDGFYGFDYVAEPNFVFNRGWNVSLDSARGTTANYDSAMLEYYSMLRMQDRMVNGLQREYDALLQANSLLAAKLDSVIVERDGMVAKLADGVSMDNSRNEFQFPLGFSRDATDRFFRDIAAFDNAQLPRIHEGGKLKPKSQAMKSYENLLSMTRR